MYIREVKELEVRGVKRNAFWQKVSKRILLS